MKHTKPKVKYSEHILLRDEKIPGCWPFLQEPCWHPSWYGSVCIGRAGEPWRAHVGALALFDLCQAQLLFGCHSTGGHGGLGVEFYAHLLHLNRAGRSPTGTGLPASCCRPLLEGFHLPVHRLLPSKPSLAAPAVSQPRARLRQAQRWCYECALDAMLPASYTLSTHFQPHL